MSFLCDCMANKILGNADFADQMWHSFIKAGVTEMANSNFHKAYRFFGGAYETSLLIIEKHTLSEVGSSGIERLATSISCISNVLTLQGRWDQAEIFLGRLHDRLIEYCRDGDISYSERVHSLALLEPSLLHIKKVLNRLEKPEMAYCIERLTMQVVQQSKLQLQAGDQPSLVH